MKQLLNWIKDRVRGIFYWLGCLGVLSIIPIILYFEQLPENPKICIDNYTREDVKVYVDGRFWLDVPKSDNLISNSLFNQLYDIDPGEHIITVESSNKDVMQKLNIEVEEDKIYVLNILKLVTYEKGFASYGRGRYRTDRGTYNLIQPEFFDATDHFRNFKTPPKSIKVRKKKGKVIPGSVKFNYLLRHSKDSY